MDFPAQSQYANPTQNESTWLFTPKTRLDYRSFSIQSWMQHCPHIYFLKNLIGGIVHGQTGTFEK